MEACCIKVELVPKLEKHTKNKFIWFAVPNERSKSLISFRALGLKKETNSNFNTVDQPTNHKANH
jgi:hypothetical protein